MANPRIYKNVDLVLSVLKNSKSGNLEAIRSLLAVYERAWNASRNNTDTKRFPFIILEGLDGCGKSTITKILSPKLNSIQWCTPPQSIRHLRDLFDNDLELRTAYYALGNYIAALECSLLLTKQAVIMDRYWHSTAVYALAQSVYDFPQLIKMPERGNAFYEWPEDLLKPDLVIFLHVDEKIRLQRLTRRTVETPQEALLKTCDSFRNNILVAYKNMANPNADFVDGNLTKHKVVSLIEHKLKDLGYRF